MGKIKTIISLIKIRQFKLIFKKILIKMKLWLYQIRAQIEDRHYGGISIDKKKLSRYKELGANATESTNYIWLDKIFKAYPLKRDDVFVDIGCGEGRVLTYLYSRKFQGELIGIELDPDVAATATERTKKCSNIHIYQGNVLEYKDIISRATVLYLFNPFGLSIFKELIYLIEEYVDHPIIVYYSNDVFWNLLDKRTDWIVLRRGRLNIGIYPPNNYTIYSYHPRKSLDCIIDKSQIEPYKTPSW